MTTRDLLKRMIHALDQGNSKTYFKLFDELQNRTIQALEDVVNESALPQ